MEKFFTCPICSNTLLKIVRVEDGKDVEHYYCNICSLTYSLSDLKAKEKKQKKHDEDKVKQEK
ncbi:hypothetical protein LLG10_05005 [bacterium]|nr:hypothetical protein [bacterium]MDD4663071.1 hypothetical protein [Caldisericia bacterium]